MNMACKSKTLARQRSNKRKGFLARLPKRVSVLRAEMRGKGICLRCLRLPVVPGQKRCIRCKTDRKQDNLSRKR